MLDSLAVRTLSRHLAARFVQTFAVAAIVATLSVTVVELLLGFDHMLAFGRGPGKIAEYLGLRLASEYASYLLPLAAFLAAFSTAALSAYANEWIALRAGGVAIWRFALPLLGCGVTVAVGTVLLHETVIVEARQEWNRHRDGDANIRFREGSFWYQRGGRIYRVREADRDSRVLREVRIFERDERGRLLRSIAADRIEILDSHRWRFLDAVFREFAPDDPTRPARVDRATSRVLEIVDPRDAALINADPASLPLGALRSFIRSKEAKGTSAAPQWALLYGRVADWTAIPLLVGVGVALGLAVERSRSLGRSAAWATLTLAGYYGLRNVGSVLTAEGMLGPGVAPAVLSALLAGGAALLLARAPR